MLEIGSVKLTGISWCLRSVFNVRDRLEKGSVKLAFPGWKWAGKVPRGITPPRDLLEQCG